MREASAICVRVRGARGESGAARKKRARIKNQEKEEGLPRHVIGWHFNSRNMGLKGAGSDRIEQGVEGTNLQYFVVSFQHFTFLRAAPLHLCVVVSAQARDDEERRPPEPPSSRREGHRRRRRSCRELDCFKRTRLPQAAVSFLSHLKTGFQPNGCIGRGVPRATNPFLPPPPRPPPLRETKRARSRGVYPQTSMEENPYEAAR